MSAVETVVARESRLRLRSAGVAVAAGVLLVAAAAVQVTGPHAKVDELTLDLIVAHQRNPLDIIGAIIEGIGWLGVAWTLSVLYDFTRARNETLHPFMRWLAIAGGVVSAASGIGYAVVIAGKANQFVAHGNQTYLQAHALTSGSGLAIAQLVGQAASLLMAISFVLISLAAMRVGLLTRFMGYLGIFAGILILFVLTPVPVVQAYWLIALGYLFSGRWPTGVPPAWKSGKAEPWPSSQEMREQRQRASGRSGPRPSPKPAPEVVGAATPRTSTRASTPKRKRKRRR